MGAEAGTQRDESFYKLIFEGSAVGLCVTELDGRIFPNQAFADMVGYRKEDLVGRDWRDITHPDDVQMGAQAIAAMIAGSVGEAHVVNRYIHKTGRVVWGEVAWRLHREEGGAPAFILASIVDVSECKQMERDLLLRNTILATEHEAFPDGILVVDSQSRVLSYNRRFLEVCSVPAEVIELKDDRRLLEVAAAQLIAPEAFLERVAQIYQEPRITTHDEIELRNGRTLERVSSPMVTSDGEILGRVWFFRDITERRRIEGVLRDRLSELERWQDVMLDREDRVGELKSEINELCGRLGEAARYPSQASDARDPKYGPFKVTATLERLGDEGGGDGEPK
jgi:PAS domain S-box-containing protein